MLCRDERTDGGRRRRQRDHDDRTGVVGSLYSFGQDYKLQDANPLARLITEGEGILVPADSPFKTVDDFVEAWQSDPEGVVVGGGSSPGGPDHWSAGANDRSAPGQRLEEMVSS